MRPKTSHHQSYLVMVNDTASTSLEDVPREVRAGLCSYFLQGGNILIPAACCLGSGRCSNVDLDVLVGRNVLRPIILYFRDRKLDWMYAPYVNTIPSSHSSSLQRSHKSEGHKGYYLEKRGW